MDEVLVAEVVHSSGDIGHELYQHLRREILQDKTERKEDLSKHPLQLTCIFKTAEGTAGHMCSDL